MSVFDAFIYYLILAVLVWYGMEALRWKVFQGKAWAYRLQVVRDQVIAAIAVSLLSKLLMGIGQHFLGKFAAASVSALIIFFILEDTCDWFKPALSARSKYHLGTVAFVLIVISLATAFV